MAKCPFHVCGKEIPPLNFACRHCWAKMRKSDQLKIAEVRSKVVSGELSEEKYNRAIERILGHYQDDSPSAKKLLAICRKVILFMTVLREYTKVPDGNLGKKQQIRAQVKKIGEELELECHDVVHPPQEQPHLFDPGEKPQGPAH